MLARIAAFVVWALVAATAVFWGLRLLVRPQPAPAYAVAVGDAGALRGDLSRLLGATPAVAGPAAPPAPELAARFKLLGLMAGRSPMDPALALIAVDSRPARAYTIGAVLDGELVLQSVSLRSAKIGPAYGATAVTLEIPPLPVAATGTLPALGTSGTHAASPAPPARPLPPLRPLAPYGAAAPPAQPQPSQSAQPRAVPQAQVPQQGQLPQGQPLQGQPLQPQAQQVPDLQQQYQPDGTPVAPQPGVVPQPGVAPGDVRRSMGSNNR